MSVRTTQVLVAVNVALAALLAWLWLGPQGGARATQWQPPAPIRPDLGAGTPMLAGFEDADTSRYMAILDRPVFSPSRKPAPVAASGPAGAPDPMQGIHLYGVYGGADGGGVIVRVDGRSRRVKVSESVGDWTLGEARGTQAVFARGAEVRTLAVVQAKPDGAQAAAGASPAAAGRPPVGIRNAVTGGSAGQVLGDMLRRAAAARGSAATSTAATPPATPQPAAPQPAAPVTPSEASPAPAPARRAAPGSSPFSIGGTR